MVTFEFTWDYKEGTDGQIFWFIGTTDVTGSDENHIAEIYEQIDAQTIGWA